jgi:hypothetical protein
MIGDEPDLADIAARFPAWEAWRGIEGLMHGRIKGAAPPVIVTGDDVQDLDDEIVRWEGQHEGES